MEPYWRMLAEAEEAFGAKSLARERAACGVLADPDWWLKVRLDWSYLNNSSNFSSLTYNEHRVLMGLQTSI